MISVSVFSRFSTIAAKTAVRPTALATLSGRLYSTQATNPPSKSATRRRIEEQQQLRNAFKLDILSNSDEDDDMLRRQKKQGTYSPNPEIPNLEKLASRWNKLDPLDQDEIILYLDDRMRGDWKEMSELEKKSGMLFFVSIIL